MKYLPQVVAAVYVKDFIVHTTFDDGTEKNIDISKWFKGPVFQPLKNQRNFRKFFIEAGTLAWPNGVDIAPEALYSAREVLSGHNQSVERRRRRPAH